MDTKWKNLIRKILKFVRCNWKLVLGIPLLLLGMFCFYILIVYRNYHPTEEAVFFGCLGNVALGPGIGLLLNVILNKSYKDWIPKDDTFYAEWKKESAHVEKYLFLAGFLGIIFAFWYFSRLISGGIWANTGGWYYNYASGYVMLMTVLIQFLICQWTLVHFMKNKLNLLMEQMTEINRQSLKKALEIERTSLEKVSRSDQLRVDLITNVSHDLKTPLTSMVGYLELMKKEELSDVVRDYLEVISDKAEKLKEMIESLFSLAKASSGNIELHMEKLEVNRLIEQIMADLEDKTKSSGLYFVTQLTEENTELVSDNLYFYRICQNLLENTLKYSAKGTRVFIKTSVKKREEPYFDECICLEITNTAGYFMDFNKEDILERFARADKARSTEGNGLGLAIVSTYARALGGEFEIQIDCDQFKACLKFPRQKTA